MAGTRIQVIRNYEQSHSKLEETLAELALKTPGLRLDLSDKDTVDAALPVLIAKAAAEASETIAKAVEQGLITEDSGRRKTSRRRKRAPR